MLVGEQMEKEYWASCDACETETQVLVLDEVPCYCPMCGSSVEFEELED